MIEEVTVRNYSFIFTLHVNVMWNSHSSNGKVVFI